MFDMQNDLEGSKNVSRDVKFRFEIILTVSGHRSTYSMNKNKDFCTPHMCVFDFGTFLSCRL